jgi:hypothetical protein
MAKHTAEPVPEGPEAIRNAMQAGAYDHLDQIASLGPQAPNDTLRHWAGSGWDLSQNLRSIFDDGVDLFNQRAANETTRLENAGELNKGFNPAAAATPDQTIGMGVVQGLGKSGPGPVAQSAGAAAALRLFPGTLKTDGELANIAKIATGPAQAVADLPRLTTVTPAFSPRPAIMPAVAAHAASLPLTRRGDDTGNPAAPTPAGSWPPFALWQ